MIDLKKLAYKSVKKFVMSDKPSEKSKHADTIIRNHVMFSMGSGFIPVPLADVIAVSAVQLDMIRQLCKVYEQDFSDSQGKAIVGALTSSTLGKIAARSATKLIPVVGTLLGGVATSIFSGASTYALGEVFKKHFESGGTILDFDAERLKKYYQEKFEKGKKVAEQLKKEQEVQESAAKAGQTADTSTAASSAASGSAVEKLKELAELKAAGIISESEFEQMKKKIIDAF